MRQTFLAADAASAVLCLATLVLVACGGGAASDAGVARDAGADLALDAPFVPPDGDGLGPPVSGLGDSCVGTVCLSTTCVTHTTACRTGYCLADARRPLGGDYCSIDCAPRPCPAGYHCEVIEGAVPHACVADAAVCGNGVTEPGETCDDHNVVPGDGCDAGCHREPPPTQHLAVDLSISATERSLGGGADTPRVAVSHVESDLAAPPGCGRTAAVGDGGVLGDGGRWEPVLLHACPPFGTVDVSATLAYATGSYDVDTPVGSYALAVCADLTFADAPTCAQHYCATTGATPSSATLTAGPGSDGGVHGRFDAHLLAQGDAGCGPVYGSTLDVTGVFDRSGL